MKEFEIYFSDLTEDAQRNLLATAGLSDPKKANWDMFPIATVMLSNDEDEDEPHYSISTNIGAIPVEDYLEIQAFEHGFESYEDLVANGFDISLNPQTFGLDPTESNSESVPFQKIAAALKVKGDLA